MSTPKKKVIRKSAQKTIDPALAEFEALKKELENVKKQLAEKEAPPVIEPSVEQTWEEKKEQMRLRDRELLAGTFKFNDVEGGHIKFVYHKWQGDPVETFLLVDGHKYALPRGVVEHLNKNCKYKTNPGNVQLGARNRKLSTHSRTSFERDDYDNPGNISELDRGYAPIDTI